jgi:hypothetical protein
MGNSQTGPRRFIFYIRLHITNGWKTISPSKSDKSQTLVALDWVEDNAIDGLINI